MASLDEHAWPPPATGEEPWVPFERPWMRKLLGAPPTFYTTSVRPDPNRKAKVQIVALDARQLELEMAIGAEGPYPPDEKKSGKWPRTGGKLPRDPAIAPRVVAAFNGAFRLDQNAHGMMIRRRTFAPPVNHVASMLMHDDGRLGFGTWGPDMKIPDDVRSLRQNLDPLLDGGEVDPRKRPRWGGILKTASSYGQRTKRSGLCRTAGGHLLYLWGDAIEAADLGTAMKRAGCDYGMHLDMNAIHVGFVFMSFDDAQYKVGHSEALSPLMGIKEKKYIQLPNPKEFFYATLRAPVVAPPIAPTSVTDAGFQPDGFAQPGPAWLPAVSTKSSGDVRTTFIDGRRVRFALTAGDDEVDAAGHKVADVPPLAEDDRERVLAAIDLGAADKTLGLVLAGKTRAPMSADAGALAIADDGRLTIALPDEPLAKSLAQAPLLLVDGKSRPLPKELSFAVGVTAHGDVVVVESTGALGTAAALVEALLHAGCVRAVAPRKNGKLERAGRDEIASGGRGTRLYVLADRPPTTTYRFDLDAEGKPLWPRVTKPVK